MGSSNNTFGIKGVEDYCFFFKSITNANELRRRMSECFERAALPHTSPEVHQVMCGLVERVGMTRLDEARFGRKGGFIAVQLLCVAALICKICRRQRQRSYAFPVHVKISHSLSTWQSYSW